MQRERIIIINDRFKILFEYLTGDIFAPWSNCNLHTNFIYKLIIFFFFYILVQYELFHIQVYTFGRIYLGGFIGLGRETATPVIVILTRYKIEN